MASLLILTLFHAVYTQQLKFNWDTVAIGGGGYVTGLAQSPNGTIYSRTDQGGKYSYDELNKRWIQSSDYVQNENHNLFGTDSLATSPHDSNILYAAMGMYENSSPHYVGKSTDGGITWKAAGNSNTFISAGNHPYRWGGERLIVHPNRNKNQTVYFGTREQGLQRTSNGGNNWSKVSSFPFKNESSAYAPVGIIFVNINPFNDYIFVSLYTVGMYMSNDDGNTWNYLGNENGKTSICVRSTFNKQNNDNVIYITCEKGVFTYDSSTKQWNDISPTAGNRYGGIDINVAGDMIVVAEGYAENVNNKISYATLSVVSNTELITWNTVQNSHRNDSVAWYGNNNFGAALAAIIFDNRYNDKVMFSDWYQVWFNDDITSNTSAWYTHESGHEEVVVTALSAPTTGIPLISGVADVEGFRHVYINKFPGVQLHGYGGKFWTQSALGIDFCEKNANIVVRNAGNQAGDHDYSGCYSTDQAQTWNTFKGTPPNNNGGYWGGLIFISPTDCNHFVWIPLSDIPYVSTDSGTTWTAAQGAPSGVTGSMSVWQGDMVKRFMRDGINGNYWYIYNAVDGKIYVSSDGGYHWSNTHALSKPSNGYNGYLSSDFGNEGNVCVCLGWNGLFCSNDYGKSFNAISGINSCRMVTFGRSQSSTNQSVMYMFGLTTNDNNQNHIKYEGAYIYVNKVFTRMSTNDNYKLGCDSRIMLGDRQTFGRVYIGSCGRGVYYSTLQSRLTL